MHSEDEIEHTGIVNKIGDNTITVKITAHPGCASCHASELCNVSGSVEKFFSVPIQPGISIGQNVKIVTSLNTGFRALFLGYVLPLIILLAALILMIAFGTKEVWAGLSAIGIVGLYYLTLFSARDRIAKKINFTLKPA